MLESTRTTTNKTALFHGTQIPTEEKPTKNKRHMGYAVEGCGRIIPQNQKFQDARYLFKVHVRMTERAC